MTLEDDLQTWSDAAGPCSVLPVALPQAFSHSGSLLLQNQQENPSFWSTNDIMSYIIQCMGGKSYHLFHILLARSKSDSTHTQGEVII